MHPRYPAVTRRKNRLLMGLVWGPLVLLGACRDTYLTIPVSAVQQLPVAPAVAPATAPFRFAVGDELEVRFLSTPDLNDRQFIRTDGKISLLHIGDSQAAGLTVEELRRNLTEAYRPILREPELTVTVRETAGQRIFVGGEVFMPGPQPISTRPTLISAIMTAQGFRPTARLSEVVVLRATEAGRSTAYVVNVAQALNGQRPENDTTLQAGDIVFVPRSNIATLNLAVDQFVRQMNPIGTTITFQPTR